MRIINIIRMIYRCMMPAVIIFILFGQASFAHGAGLLLVRPLEGGAIQAKAVVSLKLYEIRKGPIALAPEILPQPPGKTPQARIAVSGGTAATITFFDDVTYQVTVDSVNHHSDGTMTITARLHDHGIGTVVLTIGPDGFLITLQDLDRALLYRVAGDTGSATGTVTEIDVTKLPPVIR